jgi:Na+/melibiose symporter-like transporter
MLRGSEKETVIVALKQKKTQVKENFFKIWKDCLSIRAFRIVIFWILFFMMGLSMGEALFVYLMTHNIGMDYAQQGIFWILFCTIGVVTLPIVTYFCNQFGKRPVMMVTIGQAIIASLVYYFLGIQSIMDLYIFTFSFVVATASFFTFYVGFMYDCVEIDEFHTGQRREGTMASLVSFAQKCGSAMAMPITGFLLSRAGYNAELEAQTERAMQGILTLQTLLPACFWIVAYIFLVMYPMSKKKFGLLCKALEHKRAGEFYSTEGFEDVLAKHGGD